METKRWWSERQTDINTDQGNTNLAGHKKQNNSLFESCLDKIICVVCLITENQRREKQ